MCSCLQCPQLSELVRFCGSSQCLPSWSWGFNLQLYSLWEGFGSSSLVSLPQVSTVILFPPLDVGRPLRFAPEAALEGLGLPCEGQVLGWCSCLSSTRYSGELAARAAGNLVLQKGMAACIDQHAPVFLPREPCLLTEKPGRPQSTRAPGGGHYRSEPVHRHKAFFCPWQLCPSESWGWWRSCLACGGPGGAKCAGTRTASTAAVMALQSLSASLWYLAIRRPLWPAFPRSSARSGTQTAPLPGVLLSCLGRQGHGGAPLAGVLLCRSAH